MLTRQQETLVQKYLTQFPQGQPFGVKLRDFLDQFNLTYRELGKATGVPYASLSEICDGTRRGTGILNVYKIAKAFHRIPLIMHNKEARTNHYIKDQDPKRFIQHIARNIKEERERQGQDYQSLAATVDISDTTIINIERAKTFTTTSLERICAGLGIIPVYLM